MACKKAFRTKRRCSGSNGAETFGEFMSDQLIFGVNSDMRSDDVLQNNLSLFEWATRNKIYPSFWGRNLSGENALTHEEINFLHSQGCKIVAMYQTNTPKATEDQGRATGKDVCRIASMLDIPEGTAIFLEVSDVETMTNDFMKGYALELREHWYTPAFRANTDATFKFDCEYSRGRQIDKDLFGSCLIWATAPTLPEYNRMTTTHLIHPDQWKPYAPSSIARADIAIWQYGTDCHPIYDDENRMTSFNVHLVNNEEIIINAMF